MPIEWTGGNDHWCVCVRCGVGRRSGPRERADLACVGRESADLVDWRGEEKKATIGEKGASTTGEGDTAWAN